MQFRLILLKKSPFWVDTHIIFNNIFITFTVTDISRVYILHFKFGQGLYAELLLSFLYSNALDFVTGFLIG